MIPLVFILINLLHALWHYYLIKKNHLIKSGQKIIEYSLLSILAGSTILILSGGQVVPLILFCFLTRLAFFDAFLNIFRGLPLTYEGQISKKKSFYDWFEQQTGLPIMFLRVVYLAAFLIYLIIWMRQ